MFVRGGMYASDVGRNTRLSDMDVEWTAAECGEEFAPDVIAADFWLLRNASFRCR